MDTVYTTLFIAPAFFSCQYVFIYNVYIHFIYILYIHFIYNIILSTQYFLKFAKSHPVNVFAEDTDITVLLICHWKADLKEIFMSSEKSGNTWSTSSSAE